MVIKVSEEYRKRYEEVRDSKEDKKFEFDEKQIFLNFYLFSKRCEKLIDMFKTIDQFSSLSQHKHIEGLDFIIKKFNDIVDDVKRKPYDLLDFTQTQFDRDILEFNVNINDLEMSLQVHSL